MLMANSINYYGFLYQTDTNFPQLYVLLSKVIRRRIFLTFLHFLSAMSYYQNLLSINNHNLNPTRIFNSRKFHKIRFTVLYHYIEPGSFSTLLYSNLFNSLVFKIIHKRVGRTALLEFCN